MYPHRPSQTPLHLPTFLSRPLSRGVSAGAASGCPPHRSHHPHLELMPLFKYLISGKIFPAVIAIPHATVLINILSRNTNNYNPHNSGLIWSFVPKCALYKRNSCFEGLFPAVVSCNSTSDPFIGSVVPTSYSPETIYSQRDTQRRATPMRRMGCSWEM